MTERVVPINYMVSNEDSDALVSGSPQLSNLYLVFDNNDSTYFRITNASDYCDVIYTLKKKFISKISRLIMYSQSYSYDEVKGYEVFIKNLITGEYEKIYSNMIQTNGKKYDITLDTPWDGKTNSIMVRRWKAQTNINFTTFEVYGEFENFQYLIKQQDKYYSIKPEFYQDGKFTPLVLLGGDKPNDDDYNNQGFDDVNTLCTDMTIGEETFKPIDKIDNQFQIKKYIPNS